MTRIVIILVAAAAAVAPLLLVDQTFFVQTALAAIVVTGLSLFMGYAGQASLGQGAFVAVGGLTVAVGTVSLGIPPLVALVLAPVLGAAAAALVGWPLLRLRGHYLAFGSLAVLLIIQTVMATVPLFGAGVGIFGIPPLSVGGLVVTDQRVYSYLALAGLALALVVCRNLVRSRFGRGIRALAGSESAAASSGVPVLRSKLTVFAVAGAFAGFAGALGAFFTPYVSQDTFPPFVSFGYVVMAVVGGLGSVWGGVVGTLALSLWLQVLSTLSATPGMPAAAGPILQYAGYGVVLVLFLLFVPRGIVPTVAGRWAALRAAGPRVRDGGESRAAGSRARWGRSGEPVRADRAERD